MHLEKILGSARRTSTGGRTGMSTIPERCSDHRARHFARAGRPGGRAAWGQILSNSSPRAIRPVFSVL
jgi:hypothetical protein